MTQAQKEKPKLNEEEKKAKQIATIYLSWQEAYWRTVRMAEDPFKTAGELNRSKEETDKKFEAAKGALRNNIHLLLWNNFKRSDDDETRFFSPLEGPTSVCLDKPAWSEQFKKRVEKLVGERRTYFAPDYEPDARSDTPDQIFLMVKVNGKPIEIFRLNSGCGNSTDIYFNDDAEKQFAEAFSSTKPVKVK